MDGRTAFGMYCSKTNVVAEMKIECEEEGRTRRRRRRKKMEEGTLLTALTTIQSSPQCVWSNITVGNNCSCMDSKMRQVCRQCVSCQDRKSMDEVLKKSNRES